MADYLDEFCKKIGCLTREEGLRALNDARCAIAENLFAATGEFSSGCCYRDTDHFDPYYHYNRCDPVDHSPKVPSPPRPCGHPVGWLVIAPGQSYYEGRVQRMGLPRVVARLCDGHHSQYFGSLQQIYYSPPGAYNRSNLESAFPGINGQSLTLVSAVCTNCGAELTGRHYAGPLCRPCASDAASREAQAKALASNREALLEALERVQASVAASLASVAAAGERAALAGERGADAAASTAKALRGVKKMLAASREPAAPDPAGLFVDGHGEFCDPQGCAAPENKPAAEETPMSPPARPDPTPNGLLATASADASDAAWRMAASQLVKLTRDPLVAMLCRHLGPGDESFRAKVAAFLDTEVGGAFLAGVVSGGLSALPLGGPQGAVVARLARELRVKGMADAGDAFADVFMGPLRSVIVTYLQGNGAPFAALPDAASPFASAPAFPFGVGAPQLVKSARDPERVQHMMAAAGVDEATALAMLDVADRRAAAA